VRDTLCLLRARLSGSDVQSKHVKTIQDTSWKPKNLKGSPQTCTKSYIHDQPCLHSYTYVFWLKFFSFLFTVSLINFDLQSFNPSSVHVVSTAARSPDISSTWQPKRQAIQAVYAKGMMFLFLVHVYTTFTLRSHWIHTTFTLCSHWIHTTFTLRCSHFSHSHQAETVWFPGLLGLPGLPGSSTAQIEHVCFTSSFPSPCCPYVKRRTCRKDSKMRFFHDLSEFSLCLLLSFTFVCTPLPSMTGALP